MSLSLEEVRRAAILSRLRLTTEEEILFAEQLGRIVAYIDHLREFETQTEDSDPASGVEAPDEPQADPRGELFLDNAPERPPALLCRAANACRRRIRRYGRAR